MDMYFTKLDFKTKAWKLPHSAEWVSARFEAER